MISNFSELYSAVHSQFPHLKEMSVKNAEEKSKKESLYLVASMFSNQLYNPKHGWGRLWRIFYIICGERCRINRVRKVVDITFNKFLPQSEAMEEYKQEYYNFLNWGLNDQSYQLQKKDVRDRIRLWHHNTYPWLKLHFRHREFINGLLQPYLRPETLDKLNRKSDDSNDFEEEFRMMSTRNFTNIILLENLSGGSPPLPLKAFSDLICAHREGDVKGQSEAKSKAEDDPAIHTWLRTINHNTAGASPTQLNKWQKVWRKGIQSLVLEAYVIKELKGNTLVLAQKVEMALTKFRCTKQGCQDNCHKFQKPDLIHLQWVKSLKPGQVLFFSHQNSIQVSQEVQVLKTESNRIVLGKQLPNIDNETVAFEIEGDQKMMALMVKNRLQLSHMQSTSEALAKSRALTPLTISKLDRHGRLALTERIQPLNSYSWEANLKGFKDGEEDRCGSLVALMKFLVDHKDAIIPQISVNNLGIASDGTIRVISFKDGKFDFDACEEIVKHFANQNIFVFRYLMRKTNLYGDKMALYYQKIVDNTLNGIESNFKEIASQKELNDLTNIPEKGKALQEKVKEILKQCLTKLGQERELQVRKLLLELREEYLYGSQLWSEWIVKEVVDRLSQGLNL